MAGLPKKTVNRAPINGGGKFNTICTAVCVRCDSSTTCRLCRLESCIVLYNIIGGHIQDFNIIIINMIYHSNNLKKTNRIYHYGLICLIYTIIFISSKGIEIYVSF